MLSFEPVNAVMLGADVAGVDRMAEEVGDALLDNLAFFCCAGIRGRTHRTG